MEQIHQKLNRLGEERDRLRKEKQYRQADTIRERIERMGYEVTDTEGKSLIAKKNGYTPPKKSFLALFGSGEIAPSSVKTHTAILEGAGKDRVSIVVVSTPAGFQPNVKTVYEEIADFFERHLQNFHPKVQVVYANTLEHANTPKLLRALDTADYIFTGPGSPTYALHSLQNSFLCGKILERVRAGASLGLASAATMAFSRFTLPVYEIYKAGFTPYWEDGLNFYAHVFQELTIIPHFNNAEGGEKNDTSRAWMGKERFAAIRSMLPSGKTIWGIDEHTAALIDLGKKNVRTLGKGTITRL